MNMKRELWTIFCVLIGSFLIVINSAYAQATANATLFVLTSSENGYDLLSVNGNQIISIFSLSRTSAETFTDMASTEEAQAAQDFLIKSDTGIDFKAFSAAKLDTAVQSFFVAPNHQDVVVNVLYQKCVRYPRYTCFGMSRLFLVSSISKTITPLWAIGLHSTQYVPQSCKGLPTENVSIYDLRWTADSNAIVFSISGDRYCFGPEMSLPLIALPFKSQNSAFSIGEAVAWDLTDDGHSLTTVSRSCSPSAACLDTLNIMQFDLVTRQVSGRSYPFDKNRQFVPPSVADINGTIIAYTVNIADQATPIDFAFFRENRQPNFIYSQPTIYGKITSSPDNQTAIIEDAQGVLSTIYIAADEVKIRPLLQKPVVSWQWGKGKTIVVQFRGESDYTIVDEQGNTLQAINVAKDVAAVKQGVKIESVKQ